jgi:hypothetical protein
MCEHLEALDQALADAGFTKTFRGAAWSMNCREWVYYSCVLDQKVIRQKFALPECVKDHAHRGTHDGQEAGFVCELHHDAVMGYYPGVVPGAQQFSP